MHVDLGTQTKFRERKMDIVKEILKGLMTAADTLITNNSLHLSLE